MPNLFIPNNDNDEVETNLVQDMREAYETYSRDEVPKLTNFKAVLAYDYFKYGWESAIRMYSQPPVETNLKFSNKDFNLTNLQLAAVMGLNGTDKQKQEAREFLRAFINRN